MFMFRKKLEMPTAADALPGRTQAIPTAAKHFVLGTPLKGPYPAGTETAIFGLLGRGAHVLEAGRRHPHDRGRLRGGRDAKPDI
jgi:hypothetical protein